MRTVEREGRDPACPFCRTALARPATLRINAMESVSGGTCSGCGAIYLVDPTGKNVGEVMMQALALGAEMLSKDMSEMVLGEDYDDAVLDYDVRIHRSSGESKGFMSGQGRMYVLKVKRRS